MDVQHLVADDSEILAEMLERRHEFAGSTNGLESLGGTGGPGTIAEDLTRMNEGSYTPGENDGLEAIVRRFTRPVLFVRGIGFAPPADTNTFAAGESAVITTRLAAATAQLAAAVPSVGRIDLRNHRYDWVGTGWVIAPGVAVTNRHVAQEFAGANGSAFPFRMAEGGRQVKASLDWRREYERPDEAVVVVKEVLWIEPDGNPDVALLRIASTDDGGNPAPEPIQLMDQSEVDASVGIWVAVVGYPARSPFNKLADQQRIFDGVYDVKRLAPGTVMSVSPDGRLTHDATTLGGNSGSVIVDLASGKAVGLHFGGIEGSRNSAVQAPVLASLLAAHA